MTGIVRRFREPLALDGVDVQVRPGEVHALIEERGRKEHVDGVLAGAVPTPGQLTLDRAPYAPANPLDAARRVTLIHQELSLCPHLTVAENILLGGESSLLGMDRRARASRARARALLEENSAREIHRSPPA
ncbi:MAG: hypothetical protein IPK33_33195 [Gemmatimonadetes bacterium]|nr:hypothetical protein [Gemmatimonadota bacterium]